MYLFYVLVLACFLGLLHGQTNTYRAAVLEYAPIMDGQTVAENWQHNLREYLQYIQDASNQRAQIIVLPEDGLSGWHLSAADAGLVSTDIPDAALHSMPCTSFNNYSTTLRDLSCAAQNHQIYVVVNLIEKVAKTGTDKTLFYNTNVVFNKRGEIIVRYRKMNLYKEPIFTKGNQLATFTTDFGVTFGLMICSDILFKNPSEELLLNHNVTDVVYSTAWFSHLPFFHSLSTHHGYAKKNGVNLLAAGMNNPKESNGGSGIYLADGRIAETFLSGTKLSKLIIQDVPKITARTPNISCKLQKTSGSYKWGVDPISGNISSFHHTKQDLRDYTFKTINILGQRKISETICSGSSSFCCTFNITTSRTNNIPPNYVYKLTAFQGVWQSTSDVTIGVRNCAIVACTSENNDSCGDRNTVAPRGVRFEEIAVTANLDNKEVRYQPATVMFDMKPVTDYTFCALEADNGKVDVSLTTTESIDSLLTFGIMGRVFNYDNKPSGPINIALTNSISVLLVFTLSLLSCALHR